jgi:hypothetical protein
MGKHLGKREREARKLRRKCAKPKGWNYATSDSFGGVTLKLGRKKFSEAMRVSNSNQLRKKFPGCVVDAER